MALSGGATRSKLWLQMHADACGRDVIIGESAEAPLLGCAVLASALASTAHPRSGASADSPMITSLPQASACIWSQSLDRVAPPDNAKSSLASEPCVSASTLARVPSAVASSSALQI